MSIKDKKGYSLVELIISMAILAIVAGSIMLLMQSGSRSYNNTKAELDLQMESQTLMAQLNTMIMEANCVKYDSASKTLVLYQIGTKKTAMPVASGAVSKIPNYQIEKNITDQKMIKQQAGKLYLSETNHEVATPASGGGVSCAPDELLADYVNSFDVAVKGNKVTVSFEMKSGKKKYKLDETTKIRNGLVTYP